MVNETRLHFDYACATDRSVTAIPDPFQIRRYCPVRADDNLETFARAVLMGPFEIM